MRLLNLAIIITFIICIPPANSQDIDIERFGKEIEKSPVYDRAKQLTGRIEDHLNQRVSKKVEEKRSSIDSINRQILTQTFESKKSENRDRDTLFDEKSRLFIFVSTSVPLIVLKAYALDIDVLGSENTRFVFKGFPKNFLGSFLRKDTRCTDDNSCVVKARILVSKRLFRLYDIKQVPAVAYDPDPTNSEDDWLVVYGAAPLKKTLTLLYRDSGKDLFRIAANQVAQN